VLFLSQQTDSAETRVKEVREFAPSLNCRNHAAYAHYAAVTVGVSCVPSTRVHFLRRLQSATLHYDAL